MATKRRTKYQMTHLPVRVLEVKCTNMDRNDRGHCTSCGRILSRRVPHNPNYSGSLGWIEHYADGSTRQLPPGLR